MCYKGGEMKPIDTDPNGGFSDKLRSWTDLPLDILSDIAARLTLIELLSFRGTCKDFRFVSAGKSAEIQSSLLPWIFMFQKTDNSECILYNQTESKTYKRKIPELDNVICLASYKGWLLLFKEGSIFFFCPVSLTKIPLPNFPQEHIDDSHVASFSDAPTSPGCIVAVLNRVDVSSVEVNVISKGKKSWTPHTVPRHRGLSKKFIAATFAENKQTFYFMDDANSLLAFSLREKKWKPYTIVQADSSKNTETLPYYYREHMFEDKTKIWKGPLELEDDEEIAVCGLTREDSGSPKLGVYLNENIDMLSERKSLRRAVWIQPRFFEAYRNCCW